MSRRCLLPGFVLELSRHTAHDHVPPHPLFASFARSSRLNTSKSGPTGCTWSRSRRVAVSCCSTCCRPTRRARSKSDGCCRRVARCKAVPAYQTDCDRKRVHTKLVVVPSLLGDRCRRGRCHRVARASPANSPNAVSQPWERTLHGSGP